MYQLHIHKDILRENFHEVLVSTLSIGVRRWV